MKKLAVILMFVGLLFALKTNAQTKLTYPNEYSVEMNESRWDFGGKEHIFQMNYTLFGKSYARGLWYGSAGYATGMYLSNNRTGWGIVGSLLAVNLPILLDNNYDKGEVVVGQNLGALTVSAGFTIYIEITRKGKMRWNLPLQFRKD